MFNSIRRVIGLPRWVTIEVDFDATKVPAVIVDRLVDVTNRRVKWVRKNTTFKFDRMTDMDEGKFPSVNVASHLITCRNKYNPNDASEYTIWVEYGDRNDYNTTEPPPGDDGGGGGEKPVIRN